ncbi:RagB/SusD family nutrient uptake outer membrane protein [Portibacter lacus]|uniref:Membrane protein n=1 Tax=Portibacter lacus TaxID=1099794 RepID=A0AA37WH61_9BACT|nr:RagB/SusD family nutrient uptake outer membrane protein [Portibacter lacus]GLR18974.1 membrane protein [Portibacter lacus]
MKKFILIIFSFVVLVSCEKELNLAPISQVGSNGFFENTNAFTQGINGVYASLGVTGSQDYPSYYVILDESRSDNIYSPGQSGVRDWNAINNFSSTLATLGTINNIWNIAYNGIMRCNTILDQLVENGGVISPAGLKAQYEAEARFIRAFLYFDLVKWFGDVPIFDKFVSPTEALEIGRSPVTDVYNLIISDLEFAIANLPASFSGADQGRATSMAARGILAKVYLTKSGPKLHPNGPCVASGEYDKALTLLNEIINSGQFSMVDDFESIFDYNNEGNSEIVWDLQFISGGVGAGGYYPTEYYDEGWARVNLPFAGGNPGDGSKRISEDLLNSYDDADLRVEPTFQLNYVGDSGDTIDAKFYDKFMDKDFAGGDRFDWSLNYPILRYTDVLMMKAECILQGASGSQSDVDDIVNNVRARAGLDPISDINLDVLLAERRKEFAGENLRWDALVRTGKVLEVMQNFKNTEDSAEKLEEIKADFIIYPIPQKQIDVKKGLYTQNQGYK